MSASTEFDRLIRYFGRLVRFVAMLESRRARAAAQRSKLAAETQPTPAGWHVWINGRSQGPLTVQQITQGVSRGQIPRDALVWAPGRACWTPAVQIPTLAVAFVEGPQHRPIATHLAPQFAEVRDRIAIAVGARRAARRRLFRVQAVQLLLWFSKTPRFIVDKTLQWRPGGVLIIATATWAVSLFAGSSQRTAIAAGVVAATISGGALYALRDTYLVRRSYSLSEEAFRLKADIKNNKSRIRILAFELEDLSAKEAEWRVAAERRARELAAAENAKWESQQFRRCQLLAENWKAMRSLEFEQFLERAFRELGYAVQTTKLAGDQGVDLIVASDAWRIAIQIKGYFNSVSIGAVQEVYTGMRCHGCNGCAVITNSRFTAAAIEVACTVGCAMVDEDLLPSLVLGKVDLRSLCENATARGRC
jgi:hypothetical protein